MRNYKNKEYLITHMGKISLGGKVQGIIGILAAVLYVICMFVASGSVSDFGFGNNSLNDLFSESMYVAGCVIAGVLGIVFGVCITFMSGAVSKKLIGKVFGICVAVAGVLLAVAGLTEGEDLVILLFAVMIIAAAVADVLYDWITEQYIQMVIGAIFAAILAAAYISDAAMGLGFALIAVVWTVYQGVMFFVPEVEVSKAKPAKTKAVKTDAAQKQAQKQKEKPKSKQQAQKPTRKETVKQQKQSVKQQPSKQQSSAKASARPVTLPNREAEKELKINKTEAKKEVPAKTEVKQAKKEETAPKLKIMSSAEAAKAREARKREEEAKAEEKIKESAPEPVPEAVVSEPVAEEPIIEPEPIIEEPVAEPVQAEEPVAEEPVPEAEPIIEEPAMDEPIIEPEPIAEEPVQAEEPVSAEEFVPEPEAAVAEPAVESEAVGEESIEDVDIDMSIFEDTPDSLLRRATWNKGLRCRKDYGPKNIPIAFVKGRVAVYVVPDYSGSSVDEELEAEGWTVFRYLEKDITDGREQAEEINKAVKENMKADRAAKAKKKKSPAKK